MRGKLQLLGIVTVAALSLLYFFNKKPVYPRVADSPDLHESNAQLFQSLKNEPSRVPKAITENENTQLENIPQNLAESIRATLYDKTTREGLVQKRERIFETNLHHTWIRLEEHSIHKANTNELLTHSSVFSIANQAIIRLSSDGDPRSAAALLERHSLDAEPIGNEAELYRITLRNPSQLADFSQVLEDLSRYPEFFAMVEPDYLLSTSRTPNDPLLPQQAYLDSNGITTNRNTDIDAQQAWDTRSSSPNVVIAIIDSGILSTHEDLKDNLWTNPSETQNSVDDDGNGYVDDLHGINAVLANGSPFDFNGHGTHVAGIAAARGNNGVGIAGVTWDAQIMALSFIDSTGFGSTSDAITCLDYAISNGADIINNSWGGSGKSKALEETLRRASDQGILIATAAGNNGENIDAAPVYPAAFSIPNQLVVIATDPSDSRSSYSNYSSKRTHIAAPGRALSTFKDGVSSYIFLEGTSMATALATGSLAILKAQFPNESASRIMSRLIEGSETRGSLAGACLSEGRLNLDRALRGLNNVPSNDTLAKATSLSPVGGLLNGFLGRASLESGEQKATQQATGRTVWYRWTPNAATSALLSIQPVAFKSVLAIYKGNSLQALERIGSAQSNQLGDAATLTFLPNQGDTYYIQVDSASSHGGAFTIELLQAPTNDRFIDSTPLSGERFSGIASNRAATTEDAEALLHPAASGSTVWFSWTAPKAGSFYLNVSSRDGQLFSRVFTGDSIPERSAVAAQFEANSQANQIFEAIEGQTYHIAFDTLVPNGHGFTFAGSYLTNPTILSHPRDAVTTLNGGAQFNLVVVGQGEPIYEWFKDGEPIPKSDSPSLSITGVTDSDTGNYHCVVRIAGQVLVSRNARLIIVPQSLKIFQHPAAQSILEGEPLELSAFLSRSDGLDLQWYKDESPIPGATSNILTIDSAVPDDSGYYYLEFKEGLAAQRTRSVYIKVSPSSGYKNVSWITLPSGLHGAREINHMGDLLVASVEGMLATSQNGESWQYSNRSSECYAYGQGLYLAAGYEGLIQSPNGYEWSEFTPTPTRFYSLSHGANTFIAVGENATYSSDDKGVTWTQTLSFGSRQGNAAIFANERFWLSSSNGFHTSPDGSNWTPIASAPQEYGSLHFAAGRYWHIAQAKLSLSEDGQNWNLLDVDGGLVERLVTSVSSDRVFAVITQFEGGTIGLNNVSYLYQVDGATPQQLKLLGRYGDAMPGVFLAGDELFFSSQSGQKRLETYTSKSWTAENSLWSQKPTITYDGEKYFATNAIGNRSVVYSSNDGTNWNLEAQLFDTDSVGPTVSGNGQYASTRYAGASLASLTAHNADLRDIAFGNNIFVATSPAGFLYSQDGRDWSSALTGVSNISNVVFANSRFLAYSSDSIHTSSNGQDWSTGNVNGIGSITALGYGNNKYILFAGSRCYSSTNGLSWTQEGEVSVPGIGASVSKVAYFNNRFIALFYDSILFESSDGSNWQRMDLSVNATSFASNGSQLLMSTARGLAVLGNAKAETHRITASAFTGSAKIAMGTEVEIQVEAFSSADPIDSLTVYLNGQQWQVLDLESSSFHFTPPSIGDFEIEVVSRTVSGKEARAEVNLSAILGFTTYSLHPSEKLNDLIYARGAYYAACPGGRLLISVDGENWRTLQTPTTQDLLSIAETEAGFVIEHDGNGVLYSPDGVKWMQIGDFVSFFLTRNGDFFTVGSHPTPLRSIDGRNWIPIESAKDLPPEHATLPDYVEVLNIPHNESYIIRHNLTPERVRSGNSNLNNVLRLGLGFVALQGSSVWSSPDGISWTPTGIEGIDTLTREGAYVFAGGSNRDTSFTADGANWDSFSYQISSNVKYWNGLYYSVENRNDFESYRSSFVVSPDAKSWEPVAGETFNDYVPESGLVVTSSEIIAFTSNKAVLFKDSAYRKIEKFGGGLYPIDSISFIGDSVTLAQGNRQGYRRDSDGGWQVAEAPFDNSRTAYANGTFLTAPHRGGERTSTDGIDWTPAPTPFAAEDGSFPSVWYLASESETAFWASSVNNGRISRSTDGSTWTAITDFPQNLDIRTIHSFKGATYAIQPGSDNTVHKSTDNGSTWTESLAGVAVDYRLSATDSYIGILKYGSNGPDSILVSADGESWSEFTIPLHDYPALHATKDHFYLAGDQVYRSTDGQNWELVLPLAAKVGTTRSEAFLYTSDRMVVSLEENDVSLDAITVSDGEYGIGDSVDIELTLTNNSPSAVTFDDSHTLTYTLSSNQGRWSVTDGEPGASGILTLPISSLGSGESATLTIPVSIPSGLQPGQYFTAIYPTRELCHRDSNTGNDFIYSPASSTIVIPSRNLSLDVGENGKVDGLGRTGGTFAWKEKVLLSADPNIGYDFAGWSGDLNYGEDVLLVTMNDNTELQAAFNVKVFSLDLSIVGKGRVEGLPDGNQIKYGEDLDLAATPSDGWVFSGWEGAGRSNAKSFTFGVARDISLSATFTHPYSSWSEQTFGTNDPSLSAPEMDTLSYGLTNKALYALGLLSPDQALVTTQRIRNEQGFWIITYTLYKGAEGVTLTPIWSQDLATWRRDLLNISQVSETDELLIFEAAVPDLELESILFKIEISDDSN